MCKWSLLLDLVIDETVRKSRQIPLDYLKNQGKPHDPRDQNGETSLLIRSLKLFFPPSLLSHPWAGSLPAHLPVAFCFDVSRTGIFYLVLKLRQLLHHRFAFLRLLFGFKITIK